VAQSPRNGRRGNVERKLLHHQHQCQCPQCRIRTCACLQLVRALEGCGGRNESGQVITSRLELGHEQTVDGQAAQRRVGRQPHKGFKVEALVLGLVGQGQVSVEERPVVEHCHGDML
jgi:hypothetical protein